jgi:hypothetical protein
MVPPMINAKQRFLNVQKESLAARLQKLLMQLDAPDLTEERIAAIKREVEECQSKFRELGISG